MCDVIPHRMFCSITHVLVAQADQDNNEDRLLEELTIWVGAASLFSPAPCFIAFAEIWRKLADGRYELVQPFVVFPLSLPVSLARPHLSHSIDDARDAIEQALQIFDESPAHAPQFRFALARWQLSLNKARRCGEDALLDIIIALEAIFLLPNERERRTKLLRERVASSFSSDIEIRRKVKRALNNAYDIRSRIAHGDSIEGNELAGAIMSSSQLLQTVLREYLTRELVRFDPSTFYRLPTVSKRVLRAVGRQRL